MILFFIPACPCVSTLISTPNFLAALLRASSAINVCAIPVGHPVIPNIFIIPPLFIFYIFFIILTCFKSSGTFSKFVIPSVNAVDEALAEA